MDISVIIAIIILLGYTVAVCIKAGGVPPSLSASVFDLPKNRRWIWTAVLYAVVLLCVVPYVGKAEDEQTLAFVALAALGFIGAAPLMGEKKDIGYWVHCVAAMICAVNSQMVLLFNEPRQLLMWVPFLIAYAIIGKGWRTRTFWAEMVCFASTFVFCLI